MACAANFIWGEGRRNKYDGAILKAMEAESTWEASSIPTNKVSQYSQMRLKS